MKQTTAFTLIEVLIALFILATTGFVISSVQVRSFLRVKKDEQNIERIFFIKKELYKLLIDPPSAKKSEKILIEKLEDPEMKISSRLIKIPKKSSLYAFKDSLRIAQSEAVWKDNGFVRKQKMIGLLHYQTEEDEKK